MRSLTIAAAVLALSGCYGNNGNGGMDLAVASDLSAAQDDLAGGGGSGGGGGGGGNNGDGGYVTDGGIVGASCTTACDCMPGLGCVGHQCTQTNRPIYCCGSADCPNGDICQESTGRYAQCGGGTGPDLAGFDVCPYIRCGGANATQMCVRAGCTMCVAASNGMACSK